MSALEPGRRRTPFIAPVTAIADWWRRQRDIRRSLDSLDRCGDKEVAHMASDLHLTTGELRAMLRHAPDDAKLMRRRMAVLELDPERLTKYQPGVMRDLERLCSICPTKKRCVKELAQDPGNPAWREHCLNALTLSALQTGATEH